MSGAMEGDIQKRLFQLQDEKYRAFQCALMPTVDADRVIGIRTPQLRALGKEIIRAGRGAEFISELPHKYYEEDNLHGVIISEMKDYDEAVRELDRFLPYVDNWCSCDMISPAVFKKHRDRLIGDIRRWLSSGETYTVRFALKMLMAHYLDSEFTPEYPELALTAPRGEYYTDMMLAWYFATALAKQWDAVLPYIRSGRLGAWVHNKAIQKAVESLRITQEQKELLKSMRIKDPPPQSGAEEEPSGAEEAEDNVRLRHPFAPVFDESSRILILGSFPSVRSRESGFYYGHAQNRFWKVLAAALSAPVPESTEEKKQLLLSRGIALWDAAESCEIRGSADGSMKRARPNDLSVILEKADIKKLLCNGRKAYELYRRFSEEKTGISAVLMPSTSAANASVSLEELTRAWRAELF